MFHIPASDEQLLMPLLPPAVFLVCIEYVLYGNAGPIIDSEVHDTGGSCGASDGQQEKTACVLSRSWKSYHCVRNVCSLITVRVMITSKVAF